MLFLLAIFVEIFHVSCDSWCPWTFVDGNCFHTLPADNWLDADAACLALGLSHDLSGHISDVWTRVSDGFWVGLNRITGLVDFSNGMAVSSHVRNNIVPDGSGLCGFVSGGKIRYDDCAASRSFECRFTEGLNEWDSGVYDVGQRTYVCDFHSVECPEKYSVCHRIPYDDSHVCHGGICVNYDDCDCSSVPDSTGPNCDIVCNGVRTGGEPLTKPCGDFGRCLFEEGANVCVCTPGYVGPLCEPSCFGTAASSNQSCSGHGVCEALDSCLCDPEDALILNETSCAYFRSTVGRSPSLTVSAIVGGAATVVVVAVIAGAAVYLICKHREIEVAKNELREMEAPGEGNEALTLANGPATIEMSHLHVNDGQGVADFSDFGGRV